MNKIVCSHCSAVIENHDYYEISGQIICGDCRDNYTVTCDCCDSLIWDSDNCSDDEDICLCGNCYERYYTHCYRCGRIVEIDRTSLYDSDAYCNDCYQQIMEDSAIHEYGYKPKPKFFGKYGETSDRYFGVELEIDDAGQDRDNAQELLDIANVSEEHIYIKSDGSLENGMEIVTHPMTLAYHETQFDWGAILHKALSLGYRSHQSGTCGLHIHVNRKSLGSSEQEQDEIISRILYFVEHHWNEMMRFSRRSESAMNRWAARYGYEATPKKILDKAKNSYARYCAVNLTPRETVEFRLFRGTLRLNTLLATLQLVDHICCLACELTDKELQELSWSEFVSEISEPELIQYLKERRLYINNAIESEEEI